VASRAESERNCPVRALAQELRQWAARAAKGPDVWAAGLVLVESARACWQHLQPVSASCSGHGEARSTTQKWRWFEPLDAHAVQTGIRFAGEPINDIELLGEWMERFRDDKHAPVRIASRRGIESTFSMPNSEAAVLEQAADLLLQWEVLDRGSIQDAAKRLRESP